MKKNLYKSKKTISFFKKTESSYSSCSSKNKLKYIKLFHKANGIAKNSGFFYLPYKRRNHPKVLQSLSTSKQTVQAMKL